MIKKNIFYRKKKHINLYFFLIFILLFILVFIFLSKNQSEYFIVNENSENFYNIPKDKKGKKVSNADIKILDYDYNLNKKTEKMIQILIFQFNYMHLQNMKILIKFIMIIKIIYHSMQKTYLLFH